MDGMSNLVPIFSDQQKHFHKLLRTYLVLTFYMEGLHKGPARVLLQYDLVGIF